MIELLEDPLRYAELSQAGQQRARAVFEPHAVAAAYEKCYRDAVSLGLAAVLWPSVMP